MPRTALPEEVLKATLEALERGDRVAVATVLARHGSAPSTPGQKLAVIDGPAGRDENAERHPEGRAIGTVGGGAIEKAVLDAMAQALCEPAAPPHMQTFRLGASLGMCCGGSVDILIEVLLPAVHVLIVGAGHVGAFVAPLLSSLGYRVVLADSRAEAIDPARLSSADGITLVHAEHDDPEVLAAMGANLRNAAFVVMTHDHMLDQTAIEWALGKGFGFVGGVGSRAKAARTRARMHAKGLPVSEVERVRMPVGLDIRARTPAEIGVAIAGELVRWRATLGHERARTARTIGAESGGAAASATSEAPRSETKR